MKLHTVVRTEVFGCAKILCFTDFGCPAIYTIESDAHAQLAAYRAANPMYADLYDIITSEAL